MHPQRSASFMYGSQKTFNFTFQRYRPAVVFDPVCLCSQVPGCTSASNECERMSGGSEPCCVMCCSTSMTAERASSGSASRLQCECVPAELESHAARRRWPEPPHSRKKKTLALTRALSGTFQSFEIVVFLFSGGLFLDGNQDHLITVVESDESFNRATISG